MVKDGWDGESHYDKAIAEHFECNHKVSMCWGLSDKVVDSFGCVVEHVAQVSNVSTILLELVGTH